MRHLSSVLLVMLILLIFVPAIALARVAVTGISLDQDYLEMETGSTEIITATVYPNDARNKRITWHSSDKNILDLNVISNMTAEVTALAPDNAYIYAVTDDGNFMVTCDIKVYIPIQMVIIEPEQLTLNPGDEFQFEAEAMPLESNYPGLIWQSSDRGVIDIDENGLGLAYNPGQARVIARSAQNEEIFAYCNVTVMESEVEEADSPATEEKEEVEEVLENDTNDTSDQDPVDQEDAAPDEQTGAVGVLTLFQLGLAAALAVIVILLALVIRKRLRTN